MIGETLQLTGYLFSDINDGMAKPKTQKVDLGADILKAFGKNGMTRLQLAKRAGIYYSSVHCFVAGTRDINLRTASKWCEVLGLELRPKRKG